MKSDAPRTFRAPGRVNLIGEHTDYNDGFVLPVALDLDCRVTAAPCTGETLRAVAVDLGPAETAWPLAALAHAERQGDWSDYVAGVAVQLLRNGVAIPALDLRITSEVPMGAGLSSSAALEVASALALSAWADEPVSSRDLAVLCQRAEVEFVGLQCGIMDQFVSVFGRRGHALLVDCRSLDWKLVAIPAEAEIVVIDSGVKHQLAGSEYNVRRAECEQAAAKLGRPLRDISVEQFDELSSRIDGKLLLRARHIIHENQRVLDFVAAAERGELSRLGDLMAASHWSLARDYEVSCPELDFLVETAAGAQGVIGARMTGGGFGGCTVNLVERGAVEAFQEAVAEAYQARFGWKPPIYVCNSGDGAGEVAR
ncbi:MAG: galactokinase [Bryobacterales bacterium]|nr:galactokinase [Acidobacteriota bacterium]MCB9386046.1 galactokinase [Bryobacterales bacterium]